MWLPLGLFHIHQLHSLREPHLGVGLRQSDQGLQLAGVGRHGATPTPYLAHVWGHKNNQEFQLESAIFLPE